MTCTHIIYTIQDGEWVDVYTMYIYESCLLYESMYTYHIYNTGWRGYMIYVHIQYRIYDICTHIIYTIQDGEWVDGRAHGNGLLTLADGYCVYYIYYMYILCIYYVYIMYTYYICAYIMYMYYIYYMYYAYVLYMCMFIIYIVYSMHMYYVYVYVLYIYVGRQSARQRSFSR